MISNNTLCLITDFGVNNRFAGIVKGVAYGIDPRLKIFDITHEIEPFNIKEAAYILSDTSKYWPGGTVFCVIIDPGVGSSRKSVAVITKKDQFIICPDNGLLTIVQKEIGIKEIRLIDASLLRLPGNQVSSTNRISFIPISF